MNMDTIFALKAHRAKDKPWVMDIHDQIMEHQPLYAPSCTSRFTRETMIKTENIFLGVWTMDSRPNFFIAGAAKSGTTSLHHYVSFHPQVYMSEIKEPHYFCNDQFPHEFSGPGDQGFSRNRLRTLEQYIQLFEAGKDMTIRGESSVYYLYFPHVAERIYQFNPDAKIVLVLRNPADRAFSAYMHTVRDGRETLSFEEALHQEATRRDMGYQPLWWYRELGLYSIQVERYLRMFSQKQLKIILYEDLSDDTERVIYDIWRFLGLKQDITIDPSVRLNESGVPISRSMYNFFAKPNPVKELLKKVLPTTFHQRLGQQAKLMTLQKLSMNETTKKNLINFYSHDMMKLQSMIERDLSHWTK